MEELDFIGMIMDEEEEEEGISSRKRGPFVNRKREL
jgi:hypothetical protein